MNQAARNKFANHELVVCEAGSASVSLSSAGFGIGKNECAGRDDFVICQVFKE